MWGEHVDPPGQLEVAVLRPPTAPVDQHVRPTSTGEPFDASRARARSPVRSVTQHWSRFGSARFRSRTKAVAQSPYLAQYVGSRIPRAALRAHRVPAPNL